MSDLTQLPSRKTKLVSPIETVGLKTQPICETCTRLRRLPLLQGRERNHDGTFGAPYIIEVHRCPTCGHPIAE
jgi:hypothetical protein